MSYSNLATSLICITLIAGCGRRTDFEVDLSQNASGFLVSLESVSAFAEVDWRLGKNARSKRGRIASLMRMYSTRRQGEPFVKINKGEAVTIESIKICAMTKAI